jgi:hypothetical protein
MARSPRPEWLVWSVLAAGTAVLNWIVLDWAWALAYVAATPLAYMAGRYL